MKKSDLTSEYAIFGNKGSVWNNECHISRGSEATTLCGMPMLSRNWARIENIQDIGCAKCMAVYAEQQEAELTDDNGTKPFQGEIKFRSPINKENSFTSMRLADDVESIISVEVRKDGTGWYEWTVDDLEEQYDGILEFEGNMLTGYDGLFELPKQLTDFLKEQGYTMDEFIESE